MATFVERAVILDRLGIGYRQEEEWRGKPGEDRGPHRIEVFKSVHLPLTAEEWLSVAMSDGRHYMGGCCGAMSHLQDLVAHVFRMGSGWATCRELAEMALLIVEHGDFEEPASWDTPSKPIEELAADFRRGSLGPWSKMALCWHLVKDHYAPEVPISAARNRPPLDEAVHVLSRGLTYFDFKHFFRSDAESESDKMQQEVTTLVMLARILPALRTLNEGIAQLGLAPIEGFALVDKSKPLGDAVCSNGLGFCIYGSREKAEELFRLWVQSAEQYKDDERRKHLHDHIGIRPVRVTRERGIEFLDGAGT